MKVIPKKNYTLIQPEEKSFTHFIAIFKEKHLILAQKNLVLELLGSFNISTEDILLFLPYQEKHQKNGTSFVVVYNNIEVDLLPDNFNIAPTLIEAEDILEMEAIERDLDF